MKAVIIGSKSYSKIVANIASTLGYSSFEFIDDTSSDNTKHYSSMRRKIADTQTPVIIGVGYQDLLARRLLLDKLSSDGMILPNLIHPRAYVCPSVIMGAGNIVMAGAMIDSFSQVGNGNVFWPGATISHDCQIEDNCFFSPNATVCGFVKVESNCFFGANSTIVNNRSVPKNTFIKANELFKQV